MKKILLTIIALSALASSLFADIFDDRYFEIKTYTSTNVSTNTIKINNFLKKDSIIDLSAIANSVPNSGFNLTMSEELGLDFSINIPNGLILGFDSGLDLYSSMKLSKSLFDFIGKGHDFTKDETLNINCNNSYLDAFAFMNADIGWNSSNMSVVVTPTIFTSLAHWAIEKGSVDVYNKDDGTFGYELDAKLAMYGAFNLNSFQTFDILTIGTALKKGIGFDVAAAANYDLLDCLNVGANFRFPIKPSFTQDKVSMGFKAGASTTLEDIIAGNIPEFGAPEVTGPEYEENVNFYINRPMLLGVNATYYPFGNFLRLYGAFGLGYKHPFAANMDEQGVYVDYEVGSLFSLGNIINLYLSTQRKNEIFMHRAELGLNVRIVEVDIGIAAESANFVSSLLGEGLGIYAAVCIGF